MQKKKWPHGLSAANRETIHEQHSARRGFVQLGKRKSRERPILFSGPMIRAILAGKKLQTRRVAGLRASEYPMIPQRCPYGMRGDRLWVRETFAYSQGDQSTAHAAARLVADVIYQANGEVLPSEFRWRPSIFMPRCASRLDLEIAAVRVEQLHEITEEDARAEGIGESTSSAVKGFAALWDSINGKRANCSWVENPMVYVITFAVASASGRDASTVKDFAEVRP